MTSDRPTVMRPHASSPGVVRHAVVVCTRNRPDDLSRLIESLKAQVCGDPFLVTVVDASDADKASKVQAVCEAISDLDVRHLIYPDEPSLARQRNYGVSRLPAEVDTVHFVDDDTALETDYLETINSLLRNRPDVAGAGGRVIVPDDLRPTERWKQWILRFFMIESSRPGRVLPSGGLTGAQSVDLSAPLEVEFLGGCSASYRRKVFEEIRFDERLEGYSMDEDLDFSYRVSRTSKLVVEPKAVLTHFLSPGARHSVRDSRRDLLVHRYWFLEKNLRHPLRKPAFWWKIFGSYLIASLSRNPDAREARRGLVDGVWIVLRRAHPLLAA